MEIVKPGIEYRLHNFKSETEFQTVRFTEKLPSGFVPGTTNEEVISMLIDRLYELQKKNFSVENQCCIILLKQVRVLFKKRLSRKIDRVNKYQEQNGIEHKDK
jgi:mRNA-degrading endonuclease toxin of MazEF toxin-antitoxin module